MTYSCLVVLCLACMESEQDWMDAEGEKLRARLRGTGTSAGRERGPRSENKRKEGVVRWKADILKYIHFQSRYTLVFPLQKPIY